MESSLSRRCLLRQRPFEASASFHPSNVPMPAGIFIEAFTLLNPSQPGEFKPSPYDQLMSHSVRSHLRLEIDAYDDIIRKFIPGYEEGLTRAANEIAGARPTLVLDLGAGTGALAEAILEHERVGSVEAIDIDPEMLAQARIRLKRFGTRARFRRRSFDAPLPECDAVAASLALHHVPTIERKLALYERIYRALRPGGVFVNADVAISAHPVARERSYRLWAAHLVSYGIDEQRAYEHFDEWSAEDTYFPVDDELVAMREAKFHAECIWRDCPNTLLVGRKK